MRIYRHQWSDHDSIYIRNADGGVTVNIYPDRTAAIYDLIVYPESRGRRMGALLLQLAIQTAKADHCDVLFLWPDAEPWVIEWYEREGFQMSPEFKNHDGEPAWALWLR